MFVNQSNFFLKLPSLHPWTLNVLAHYYNFGSLVVTSQRILKHRSLSTTMPNHLLSKEIASDKTRTSSKGSISSRVRCLRKNPPAASLEHPREREVMRLSRAPKEVKLERSGASICRWDDQRWGAFRPRKVASGVV